MLTCTTHPIPRSARDDARARLTARSTMTAQSHHASPHPPSLYFRRAIHPCRRSEPAVPDVPYRVDKPWGYELVWARTDRYVGKILHVKAGHVLSLQYHNVKDETMHVLRGEL